MADVDSAEHFLSVVKVFGEYSNLQLNKEKTQGLWLGKNRHKKEEPLGIAWPDKPLKLLGIYIYMEACDKLNYDKKLAKCKTILNWWKSRNLTIIGRIQVVKTFIISQFLYASSVIYMPEKYISEVNKMIRYFVWKGKSKLSRTTMYRNKEYGGLRMPDFRTMIRASQVKWIYRLVSNKGEQCWRNLQECMKLNGIENLDLFMEANYNLKRLKNLRYIPKFYVKALDIWQKNVEVENSRENVIWYNGKVTVDKNMVYHRDFYEAGIIYLSDLIDKDGNPFPFKRLVDKGLTRGSWLRWLSVITSVKACGVVRQEACEKDNENSTFTIGGKKINKVKSRQLYDLLLLKQYDSQTWIEPSITKFTETNIINYNKV